MTESIYIHLQCFWYGTVFITSTFFCKKFCFVRQKQTPLDQKNKTKQKKQLRHNFVVFLLNEKTEKVQKWVGSAIVFENHSTMRKSICLIGTLITGQFRIVQYLLKYSFK